MGRIALPRGCHYAVTWGIPDNYSGMTTSMLHRSRAFVELTGSDVTILTFEHRDDQDVVRARLRDRGAMIEGMHLRNLWEDLRGWDDEQLKQSIPSFGEGEIAFSPLGDRGDHSSPFVHVLRDGDDIRQVDYFRPDGTLLVSDRRRIPGRGPRAVTLCDTGGAPLGTWRDVRNLYWLWLDHLPRDPIAWLICDSKTPAKHLTDYRRPDVVTLHVVRASHLEPGTGQPIGQLRESRKYVMAHLNRWDAVVFLTRHQLDDVEALLGPGGNRHVIPNGRSVPPELQNVDRPSTHGVMLASLVRRKQVGHAIRAMNRVRRLSRQRVTLDVWGQGPLKRWLSVAINSSRAPVRLRGHSPGARDEFYTASFSLLTSTDEAFGNVVLESMAHGCIPISYDMPYGPADLITHGVDGFLVPPDDIRALAKEICRIATATPAELAPIRAAAHLRALEFDDARVAERWAAVMAGLAGRTPDPDSPSVVA